MFSTMPPLPTDVVHITSVAAALQKINVGIPIEGIIKAIRDEEELLEQAKLVKLAAEATRQDERKSAPDQAAQFENESVQCFQSPVNQPMFTSPCPSVSIRRGGNVIVVLWNSQNKNSPTTSVQSSLERQLEGAPRQYYCSKNHWCSQ
jgi:hypothetical protein